MVTARYHKVKIGEHELNAETLMLGYGYDPSLSEGSVKPPVFLTSTFVFQTAEQGRDFFDYLAGRRAPPIEGFSERKPKLQSNAALRLLLGSRLRVRGIFPFGRGSSL